MRRPLLGCGLLFVAGLALPPLVPLSCAGAAGAACFAGVLLLSRAATRAGLRMFALPLLLAGYAAAGAAVGASSRRLPPEALEILVDRFEATFRSGVALTGRVVEAERLPDDEGAGPDELALTVAAESVTLLKREFPVRGRARLRVPWDDRDLPTPGERLAGFARLWRDEARLPLAGEEILRGRIKSSRLMQLTRPREPGIAAIAAAGARGVASLRGAILKSLDRPFSRTGRGRRGAGVAAALVLGERSGLTPEDRERLAAVGLTHLLAVSGFNVAVLAGAAILLLRGARTGPRAVRAVCLFVLILYLLLNRDESSVARAVVMALVWLGGGIVWRRSDPLNRLGLAALLILAREPASLADPGFQLTFAATAALIVIAPRWARASTRPRRWAATLAAFLRAALAVTLAATLATLPLTLVHFHRVIPGAIPANLAAGPLMAAAFLLALLLPALVPIAPAAAGAVAGLLSLLVDGVFRIAAVVGSLPGCGWEHPGAPAWATVLFLLGLLAWALPLSSGRRAARWSRAAGVIGLLGLAWPADRAESPRGLRITALDVGQGDAILIESPGGARALIDAGGRSAAGFDAGERRVAPALWAKGIARLDLLVVTHRDMDHAGGAAAIARRFRPARLWLPPPAGSTGEAIDRLARRARDAGLPVEIVRAGSVLRVRDLALRVLSPPLPGAGGGLTGNESSLVIEVSAAGSSALLMGDAGERLEASLGAAFPAADLLKVGHHGSRTATTAPFLRRVRPRVALISCGRGNRFGHPHAEVLQRLRAAGSRICRTDREGETGAELAWGRVRLLPGCAAGER